MSQLIDKLKDDHKKLVEILTAVKTMGPTAEGFKKLQETKTALLAHLGVEDAQLYPKLRNAGKTDPKLQGTLDMFAKDMEKLAGFAMGFFEKYSGTGPKGAEFGKDFGKLCAELSNRIGREERILYAEFERLENATEKKSA